jgi:hypothetical protein
MGLQQTVTATRNDVVVSATEDTAEDALRSMTKRQKSSVNVNKDIHLVSTGWMFCHLVV